MTNTSSFNPIQSIRRVVARLLPRSADYGKHDAEICCKVPPRLSLLRSFVQSDQRHTGPDLTWFEGNL